MVAIPTAQALADANIDSLERLVVALGLHFSQLLGNLPSTSAVSQAVTVSLQQRRIFNQETQEQEETTTINFSCRFNLEGDYGNDGGELLSNVLPFLTGIAPTFPLTPPSLETEPALSSLDIPSLTTAEQLMVWALLTLSASLHPNSRDYIQIDPRYGDSQLRINCQLPGDRQALGLSGFQLIAGVQRVAGQYVELNSGAVAAIAQDAYEIAVDEGYLGTRAEWLESLKGEDGEPSTVPGPPGPSAYEVAVDEGYLGTRAEWLESLKGEDGEPSTVPGAPGPSAYEVAVDEGYLGTRAEWLESLKGEDGEPSTVPGPTGSVEAAGALILDLVPEPATPAPNKLTIWASALDGLIYQKDEFGIIKAISTGGGGRELLTADRTYYVRADGSDSNNGLTNTAGGAFATIQKAVEIFKKLDINGWNLKIKICTNITTANTIRLPQMVGGVPIIEGDTTTPSNIAITGTASSLGSLFYVTGEWVIDGIKFITTGSAMRGINTVGGKLSVNNLNIGATTSHGIVCELNGLINGVSSSIVRSGSNNSATIIALLGGVINLLYSNLNMSSGSATHAYRVLLGGCIDMFGATRTGSITQLEETGGQIRV
ncbi:MULTISPECIES: hypothetical protein [unclassified Synechocystis]|uniref:hypothetical protein n=1 Tax=unclassified Synechocystis TaxID=2640012 RepID=UPI0004D136BE|nr:MULTISPECIES: hypothetical protein [unclassified Synechocystis]AIE73863.1 hypothetical protein D082_13350 [Synechocystis sp. PCC 6714]MCT0252326.1 hypothetical protein [Synechocystis sp. CS-94]